MRHLPLEVRRCGRRLERVLRDRISGRQRDLQRTAAGTFSSPVRGVISLTEPLLPTASLPAKRHNLELARQRLHRVVVPPGAIFSFWRVVGCPSLRNGFQEGRSLLGGRIVLDAGGGLCQLSGMIYVLGLMGNLEILERHPHSRDIYVEENRPGPLGSDATVAFGFKDLQLRNTHPAPLRFRLDMELEAVHCRVECPDLLPASDVRFVVTETTSTLTRVETWRQRPSATQEEMVARDMYPQLDPLTAPTLFSRLP